MPPVADRADFYLVIKLRVGDKGRYLLEAYDTMPTGSEEPLASAVLPVLEYDRLTKALASTLDPDRPALQPMGDYLAEWLFIKQPSPTPLLFTHSSTLPSTRWARTSENVC